MSVLKWLLIALIILFFLFLLILVSKLTVRLNYFHHNDNDQLTVEFRIWFGLIKYKMDIPLIKIDEDSPSVIAKGKTQMGDKPEEDSKVQDVQITPDGFVGKMKNMKEIIKHVMGMNVIVMKFLKKVSIKHLEWHSLLGTGDAANTGVITGAIWAIKGGIVGILSQFFKLKEMPILSVTPHFQFAVLQTHLTCIFQFRIGHAILAGLKLIKFWRGGLPNLKMAAYSKEKTKSV